MSDYSILILLTIALALMAMMFILPVIYIFWVQFKSSEKLIVKPTKPRKVFFRRTRQLLWRLSNFAYYLRAGCGVGHAWRKSDIVIK
jgi:ABC-type glycerol-3-phosphate transport system permease component